MSNPYDYEYYHSCCGPIAYEEPEHWVSFFGMIADHIVNDLHPKTVLDAGCAMGYLVAALRDRGVEAYGIDISEYAISQVREDIRPYCAVGSLTEPFPEILPDRYDLVVTIEVLEHLYAEDGKTAIKKLCELSDQVLFSSTPDDYTEKTHVNVQQREYWARLFAENGFFDDLSYRPTYLTYYASLFKKNDNLLRQIEDYERFIRNNEKQLKKDLETIESTEHAIAQAEARNTDLQNQLADTQNQLTDTQSRLTDTQSRLTDTQSQLAAAQYSYDVISNAFFWKLTKPMRAGVDFLYRFPFFLLSVKGLKSIKNDGLRVTERKVRNYFQRRKDTAVLATKELYSKEELEAQKEEVFPKNIKISIVVPLYNTPKQFLREMIQSLLDQTYSDWELCMADGSDDEHDYVQRICKEYARKDNRIKYQKLKKNLGISGNTNACLEMVTGDYIALLDHDDLLHPAALHDVMKAICEQDADFIYTDESSFHKDTKDAFCPHFKPDFAPDSLRGLNYICHLAVFKKKLLDEAGMFRPECDGSQDYDMILRLTEKAQRIIHIPEILYYWRAHKGSTAESIAAKPYVIQAAHKALSDHLERIGIKGEVLDSVVPSVYRIKYEIIGTPLISIMIPNYEHKAELETCLNSIFEKSTYTNFEIIVIENNSKSDEIFAYYDEIQKKWSNVKVVLWDGPFNYSAINNYGVAFAKGEHILLLNNDIEVITPDWIQEMLMFSQRSDVGAVGAMLYYPDDTIQHAGVILGIGGVGGHSHKYFKRNDYGYMSRLTYAQNLSAVTAACLMVKKSIWDQLGGLDEDFQVAFNDVDFCMRIRQAGYLNVWTPFAELYHYESKSRGIEDTSVKRKRFESEVRRFQARWTKELAAGDPYYNPNLTLNREDFSLR